MENSSVNHREPRESREEVKAHAQTAEALVTTWRDRPKVDLATLRRDIDEVLEPFLPLDDADLIP